MLIADDRCIMVATCGYGSLCPCPVCLVPITGLVDLSTLFEMRMTEPMKATLASELKERLATDKEAILKKFRLREVDVSVSTFSLYTSVLIPHIPELILVSILHQYISHLVLGPFPCIQWRAKVLHMTPLAVMVTSDVLPLLNGCTYTLDTLYSVSLLR